MRPTTLAEPNCCGHGLINLLPRCLSDMTSFFINTLVLSVILYNSTLFALNFSFKCDILKSLNQRE